MATALDADKAIDLAARQWAERAKAAVRENKRLALELKTLIEARKVHYIDLTPTARLCHMAG